MNYIIIIPVKPSQTPVIYIVCKLWKMQLKLLRAVLQYDISVVLSSAMQVRLASFLLLKFQKKKDTQTILMVSIPFASLNEACG
jgi:hypothetical protein